MWHLTIGSFTGDNAEVSEKIKIIFFRTCLLGFFFCYLKMEAILWDIVNCIVSFPYNREKYCFEKFDNIGAAPALATGSNFKLFSCFWAARSYSFLIYWYPSRTVAMRFRALHHRIFAPKLFPWSREKNGFLTELFWNRIFIFCSY